MACRAVIFDFEGTLVDFQWNLEEGEAALRAAFAGLGFSPAVLRDLSYSGLWNMAAAGHPTERGLDELRRTLGPVYDQFDLDALSRWRLRDGAVDLLRAARDAGLRSGIVSNIGRLALDGATQRLGLRDFVESVLSRDDVRLMKPSPEGLCRVLAGWQLSPMEALFVGDSLTDVRTARSAGVPVAIVAGGESSAAALEAEPPDHYVVSLSEVRRLLVKAPDRWGDA